MNKTIIVHTVAKSNICISAPEISNLSLEQLVKIWKKGWHLSPSILHINILFMTAILFLRYFATYIYVSFMCCNKSTTLKMFTYSSAVTKLPSSRRKELVCQYLKKNNKPTKITPKLKIPSTPFPNNKQIDVCSVLFMKMRIMQNMEVWKQQNEIMCFDIFAFVFCVKMQNAYHICLNCL